MRLLTVAFSSLALICGVWSLRSTTDLESSSSVQSPPDSVQSPPDSSAPLDRAGAADLVDGQPGFYVPNLGQWGHAARFVHRRGPMTLFLQDRGWVIDLAQRPAGTRATPSDGAVDSEIRGVALRMTFAGDPHLPEIVGEEKLSGCHNYFLGDDESRWRTNVPLFVSVRYENLYPGIDLRLREASGSPEYDLLLQPGADLARVSVHVEGADRLRIASDGSLVIDTALGPLTQPAPKTWEVDSAGNARVVACRFILLARDRFGFEAPEWAGDTDLTIDPGLIWSTYLGGSITGSARAVALDANGVVSVTGQTLSVDFPTTLGAYQSTKQFAHDIFVSQLDPGKSQRAQLVYSTFLGGRFNDQAFALSLEKNGVVTIAGETNSPDFPTTSGAYDTTFNGGVVGWPRGDVFVVRLAPSRPGVGQLLYSSFLGGDGADYAYALAVSPSGVVTVAGRTRSKAFPTTNGAFATRIGRGSFTDGFVSRLDPRKTGAAQLVYSTYLGGTKPDSVTALAVDSRGVTTVTGETSSRDFPTTTGAFDATFNGGVSDFFVSRLDPRQTGRAQLVYSSYLGGSGAGSEGPSAIAVAASGVISLVGTTNSHDFPTTIGAFDTSKNGNVNAVVSRLDPSKTGAAQLVYSTHLGGRAGDWAFALAVDTAGVMTVAGRTGSPRFPTTANAYSTTGGAFISRLDPRRTGVAQLVYSTRFGGTPVPLAIAMDPSGVVTIAGSSHKGLPTTSGAFRRSTTSVNAVPFVSRLDMGVAFHADRYELSRTQPGGQQQLTLNAGKVHAGKLYWIFGSITGTTPGVKLLGVQIPLNPDVYTDAGIANVNSSVFTRFRGQLDANGRASASFNVPANLPVGSGFTFYHAYLVYDASGKFYMASGAVPLRLK